MTNMKKRRTLRDIAKVANVSEMTVSRVLRGSDVVSNKTKRHVLSIVEELGYVQNKLAGSLASSRSNQIAVIIPSLINHVFTEVMGGITSELDKAGYQAVVGISDYSLEREEELVYSMMSWRPAGIIVTNFHHNMRTSNVLANANIPVVEMMAVTDNPIDVCVGIDHVKAGRVMAKHLLSKGYRNFGYVGWNGEDYSAAARFAAFQKEIQHSDATLVSPDLFKRPPNFAAGKNGLKNLLEQHKGVEAVFFSNDTAASGGYVYCLEAGISVPHDLAIAGFSGLETGQHMPKPLTTIQTPRFETGRLSARSILNRLTGLKQEKVWVLGFNLLEGQTA